MGTERGSDMATQMTTVKLSADTVKEIARLARMGGVKGSRHRIIQFALWLSSLVVMHDNAKREGTTTQSLEDFLALVMAATQYEFGKRER